jgi:hypothetical protein
VHMKVHITCVICAARDVSCAHPVRLDRVSTIHFNWAVWASSSPLNGFDEALLYHGLTVALEHCHSHRVERLGHPVGRGCGGRMPFMWFAYSIQLVASV